MLFRVSKLVFADPLFHLHFSSRFSALAHSKSTHSVTDRGANDGDSVEWNNKEKYEVWMDIDLEIHMHDQEMEIGGGARRERERKREECTRSYTYRSTETRYR